MSTAKRRRRISAREREALEWMPDILNMVHERLAVYLGEEWMRGTAPIFYDDAITAVAYRAAYGKLPEEMYPEGSLLHRLRASERNAAKWARRAHRFRAALKEVSP